MAAIGTTAATTLFPLIPLPRREASDLVPFYRARKRGVSINSTSPEGSEPSTRS